MSEKLDMHDSAEAARRLAGEGQEETSSHNQEAQEAIVKHAAAKAEAAAKPEKTIERHVEKIEKEVEAAAPQDSELLKRNLAPLQETQPLAPPGATQKLQSMRTYLVQARHHLSGPSKQFSEFVHNPAINALSENAGKTLVRPSGILAGGLLTLVGSGWYYYATKNTGYTYNFMFALLLFVGGFFAGVIIEMILKTFTKRRPVS